MASVKISLSYLQIVDLVVLIDNCTPIRKYL